MHDATIMFVSQDVPGFHRPDISSLFFDVFSSSDCVNQYNIQHVLCSDIISLLRQTGTKLHKWI